ncbi:hypothetical protein OHS58_37290 [Amycolatopsis sp. NBC_00348]|uniref:hypothetical protein n=1 Tax=Amycolatopsis sp. NBC_00348 TaxID=2975956 RepID=UPI002E275AC9
MAGQPHGGGAGKPPFMEHRTVLILLVAFVCGTVAGVLTFLAYHNVAGAVLAGIGAAGGAIIVLHQLLD